MDTTEVVIVGAGPSGLVLALSLARFKIKSIVIEKEIEITQDPRGVCLTHDAIRILWSLGIGDEMTNIGHEMNIVNFHKTSFAQQPFHKVDLGQDDGCQVLPNYMLQIQPRLERFLRKKVENSPFCDLQCGCTVVGREQYGTGVIVEYTDTTGRSRRVRGSWLVGADGKRGVVRKRFLEPSAGIKQVGSSYQYDGTWVAANLKLTLPTPRTHPDFPLWDYGYTPEGVYDLFWPKGWHFCSPPGKPTAAGRFGPHEKRYWRHEFAQNDWDDSMSVEDLFWEHITPMITRKGDELIGAFPCGEVAYPRDCIEIRRCRPFRFTHKVVNRWFDDRTILIGDAAHVFPPFGGQGIGCGLRDAYELSWRLFILQRSPNINRSLCDRILGTWAQERVQGVKDSASMTQINGKMCNEGPNLLFWMYLALDWVLRQVPLLGSIPHPVSAVERRGYKPVKDGTFSAMFCGGGRIPQIYFQSEGRCPILSDSLLSQSPTAMSLLLVARDDNPTRLLDEATKTLSCFNIGQSVLSEDSLIILSPTRHTTYGGKLEVYYPASRDDLASVNIHVPPTYNESNYLSRFKPDTKFVIVRGDFYIFSIAKDSSELAECLVALQRQLSLLA
ncbi:monooxygenase-like protein [Biscogniauxia mediterranea]|nr:monooxygenase-like protein [Biscogniauxia mediterranea]